MRFLVNFEGVADGKKTYHKRIYLQEEDKDGFLKRLVEKNSKIDGMSVVTAIRDDVMEEVKSSIVKVANKQAKEELEIKELFGNRKRKKPVFSCSICGEQFDFGVKLGKHKKEKHADVIDFQARKLPDLSGG